MQKILHKGLLQLDQTTYLKLIIIIVPLLNFLSGINIDLYTPSLPAITQFYSTSAVLVKNTITANMLGFALGCLLFGTVIDILGRRSVILFGLLFYAIASLLALICTNINQLILIRFVQGILVSTVSIGSRTLISDVFTGHHFNIALLYTSLAWSLGPIIGPFIGGILQYHFGWQANFLAYTLFSFFLFAMFALFVNESLAKPQSFSLKGVLKNYLIVISNKTAIACIIIGACSQIEFLLYPTLGAFIVENILGYSAIVYGNTALIISCGYLLGNLVNRFFIKKLSSIQLTIIGFIILIFSLILLSVFAVFAKLNLITLVLPITMIGFSNGFVFPNSLGRYLRLFPNLAGTATAIFTCLAIVLSTVGIFIISHLTVHSLLRLVEIIAVIIAIQLFALFLTDKQNK